MSDEVKPIPEEVEATVEVVTPTKEQKTSSKFKTNSEFVLPATGQKMKLFKLKAGKYYEAQKIYVEWIEELTQIFSGDGQSLTKAIDAKGVVDEKKLKEQFALAENKKTVSNTLKCANKAAEYRMDLVAICLGVTIEIVNEEYYPEDIDIILDEAIILNNFIENVKKSAALSVGGQKTEKKK